MKILHVAMRLAEVGPPRGVVTLAQAQATQGDEVVIFPCSSGGGKMLLDAGLYGNLTVVTPPTHKSLKFPDNSVKTMLFKLAKTADNYSSYNRVIRELGCKNLLANQHFISGK